MLTAELPPVPTRSAATGRSRLAGLIALTVAFVLVIAVAGLTRRDIAGAGTAAPLPSPPTVGSCLTVEQTPDGVHPVRVSCDEPHRAEVTRTWPAGDNNGFDPAGGEQPSSPGPFPELDGAVLDNNACRDAAADYVGPIFEPAVVGWHTVTPSVVSGLVGAPFDERVGNRGWSACLVLDGGGRSFQGSLRNMTRSPDGGWPIEFGVCVAEIPGGNSATCTEPHRIELLGVWQWYRVFPESPDFYTALPATELMAGCLALAAEVIGTSDPTFGGRLTVHAESLWFGSDGDTSIYFTGADGSSYSAPPPPDCWVETGPGTVLLESVRGLGDGPLPTG